ncbi:MAG: MBL fold metallo-hydrolase [Tannerellaceae bacterium]|nr:MBL fold metallo-hydrolase [Tannerellaceae bacterium]
MKLTVLVDNNTFIDQYFCGEPALSFYLEDEDTRILFDTAYSDVFIKNAEKMGIDLSTELLVVLSHGHNDHTGGLRALADKGYLANKHIIAHPGVFSYREENGFSISAPFACEEINPYCRMTLATTPLKISSRFTFLGEIPELFDFEKRYPVGVLCDSQGTREDKVLDDSALVYQSEEGLFIITGCSHSGICNIIEYAKQVCDEERIAGVIGGFHLFDISARLMETIAYLKRNQIALLYPCHCISFAAKAEMYKTLPVREVGVGLEIYL